MIKASSGDWQNLGLEVRVLKNNLRRTLKKVSRRTDIAGLQNDIAAVTELLNRIESGVWLEHLHAKGDESC